MFFCLKFWHKREVGQLSVSEFIWKKCIPMSIFQHQQVTQDTAKPQNNFARNLYISKGFQGQMKELQLFQTVVLKWQALLRRQKALFISACYLVLLPQCAELTFKHCVGREAGSCPWRKSLFLQIPILSKQGLLVQHADVTVLLTPKESTQGIKSD